MEDVPEHTDTWPLESADQRAAWDRWSKLIGAARHPSLARVVTVSRTESVGTLILADPGSEDVLTWVDRTGADVPTRLGVLRAAASALDALHATTTDGASTGHGNLTTANVRVDPDGATRLVGFAPWSGTARPPMMAPEAQPGSPATPAADAYAFAVIVAVVLGGEGARTATDLEGLFRALRVSADTRRRVRLIKAIHLVLEGPPETRPTNLTAWLAGAVEGTAVTEMSPASAATTVAPESAGSAVPRSDSWLRPARIGLALATAAAVGLGGWIVGSSERPPAERSSERSGQDTVPIDVEWAWAPACGEGTGIASEGLITELTQQTDLARLDVAAQADRGGRWHQGRLLITLRARSSDSPVTFLGARAERTSRVRPPSWRARSVTECEHTDRPAVRYLFDADRNVSEIDPTWRPGRQFGSNGSGSLSTEPTLVTFDATACDGNYGWQITISYLDAAGATGTTRIQTPYLFGRADRTLSYVLGDGVARPLYQPGEDFSGPDPRC